MSLAASLRQSIRSLARARSFTIVCVSTLAIGIGANSAIFSVIYGVLLRPMPFHHPDALVQINAIHPGGRADPMNFSIAEFADWQLRMSSLEDLALFGTSPFSLSGGGNAEAVRAAVVAGGFFRLVGERLRLGRGLRPDDDRSAVVVLSSRLWTRRFGEDSTVLDRSILLNGIPVTVVGVAGAALDFPDEDIDLWVPAGFATTLAPKSWTMRGYRAFSIFGRLRPGESVGSVNHEAAAIAAVLAKENPRFNSGVGAVALPLRERLTKSVRPALLLLMGSVGFVLLIACANVASLLLARGASRRREIAVRSALGASRGRLIARFLAESAMLGAAGAAAGLLVAAAGVGILRRFPPVNLPFPESVRLDLPVVLFTSGLAIFATLIFGMAPALAGSRQMPMVSLRTGGGSGRRATRRLHQFLVTAEVALSVTLLVGGLLLAGSLTRLLRADIGVTHTRVWTMKLNLATPGYSEPANAARFLSRVLDSVSGLPGVRSAAAVSSLPPQTSQMHFSSPIRNETTGQEEDQSVEIVAASGAVFETLGIPLRRGRAFSRNSSDEVLPVAIVSEDAARRWYRNGEALGRPLPFELSSSGLPAPVVVGIVADVKFSGLDSRPDLAVYLPYSQRPFRTLFLVVHGKDDRDALESEIRQAVARIDREVPISEVRRIGDLVNDSARGPRFRTLLFAAMAVLALALCGIGLYGVVSHSVAERTSEIAIRIAFGASKAGLRRMVLIEGLRLTSAGLLLGLACAAVLSRLLGSFRYGVTALDLVAYGIAPLFLLVVSAGAALIPARRATNVDPIVALRSD